jgi:hypothetical protein
VVVLGVEEGVVVLGVVVVGVVLLGVVVLGVVVFGAVVVFGVEDAGDVALGVEAFVPVLDAAAPGPWACCIEPV